MSLQRLDIAVIPALREYVERIFVFSSSQPFPRDDLKLILPNGLVKLIIPVSNNFSGTIDGCKNVLHENKIMLIGADDLPTFIAIQKNEAAVNVTLEFKPNGAYRFFYLNFGELKNKAYSFTEIFGKQTQSLEEEIGNTKDIFEKIQLLQLFLSERLQHGEADTVFDFSVQKIKETQGMIPVKVLEKKTGYTLRWLNMKFAEKMGISPKSFASICRFQSCHSHFNQNPRAFLKEKEFYNYFYDQTHFIKEFRRFTGLPPVQLMKASNSLSDIF